MDFNPRFKTVNGQTVRVVQDQLEVFNIPRAFTLAELELVKEIIGERDISWEQLIYRCEERGIRRLKAHAIVSELLTQGKVTEPMMGWLSTRTVSR